MRQSAGRWSVRPRFERTPTVTMLVRIAWAQPGGAKRALHLQMEDGGSGSETIWVQVPRSSYPPMGFIVERF